MSKASEWAKRLEVAEEDRRGVYVQRPEASPRVWASGTGFGIEVGDNGRPRLDIVHSSSRENVEICWAEDITKLCDLARWILHTFGEDAPR